MCTISTVEGEGRFIIVWAISVHGPGRPVCLQCLVNSGDYINMSEERFISCSDHYLPVNFIFIENNGPIHTAYAIIESMFPF